MKSISSMKSHLLGSRLVWAAAVLAVCSGGSLAAAEEFRALASSRFEWPDKDMATCKAYIDTMMQKLHDNNFNAVILQMRGQCDTLYPSPYEPWSYLVSPDGNVPPGWGDFDPMAYAINAAHANGLEFHAYLNANVCWNSATDPQYCGWHPYYQYCDATKVGKHDWLLCDSAGTPVGFTSEYVWVAPGVPSFQAYWRKQIMYVVEHYDGSDPVTRPAVDGVHFDRARLPANTYSYDPISQSRRLGGGNPAGLSFGDWQADQITRMLTDVYAEVNEYTQNLSPTHHTVKVSSAPLGLYLQASYPGYPSYYLYGRSQCYQDAQAWLAAGAQDFIVPQIYWADPPYRSGTPYFSDVLPDWLNHNAGRHVYPYCNVTATGPGLVAENTVMRSMVSQTGQGNAPGSCIWVYKSFNSSNYWDDFNGAGKPYEQPTTVPTMPWKTAPTDAIVLGNVTDGTNGITDVQVTRNGSTYTALSSEDGLYSFLKVPPGTYTLTYSKAGLVGTTRQVTVTAGQVLRVADVVLNNNAPPVITNVAASGVTNAAATITWTTNTDATSQVQYGLTTSYGSTSPLNSTAVKSHSVGLAGLTASTLYHYRVISTNTYGTTNSIDYTFSTGGPPTISNVQSGSITATAATITWTTSPAANSQVFYGLTSSYGSSSTLDSTNVTSHSVALSGLTGGTTYHYKVVSANTYGSAESADATFATQVVGAEILIDNTDSGCSRTGSWTSGSVAAVPKIGATYLYASANASSATATCRWTPSIPAAGNYDVWVYYQIGGNRTSAATYTVVYNGTPAVTSVQDQYSTTANQGGWFLVGPNLPFAAGSVGYVEVSNYTTSGGLISADAAKFVRVSADTQAPTVPTGVNATAVSTTSMQVSWTASTDDTGVTGYRVFRNGSAVGTSTTTSYTDTGLIANTLYCYKVSAYDGVPNESAQSLAVYRATLSVPPSASTITCDRVTGTWYPTESFTFTAVGGFGAGTIGRYGCIWDNSPTDTWIGMETSWWLAYDTYVQRAIIAGQPWYLHVRGYNLDGIRNGTIDFGPYLADPTGPSMPVVVGDGAYTTSLTTLHATWDATDPDSGIKRYEYRINRLNDNSVRNWTDVGTATSVTVTGLALTPRRLYKFGVRATNNAGVVSDYGWSDPILVFPYDVDDNGKVDAADLAVFSSCAQGAGVPYPPTLFNCGLFDSDSDQDVDMDDFGLFQRCYTGEGAIDSGCLEPIVSP
jgi:uncharacterized lipoprotein YddW (UPF0748 family)